MASNQSLPRQRPPICPGCKRREWGEISVEGRPPGDSWATCGHCKNRWQVCGAHPDAVRGPCMVAPSEDYRRCGDHGAHGGRSGFWANERERRFVVEFLIDLDGEEAVKRAGFKRGAAIDKAKRLLKRPDIRAAIEKAMAERAVRVERSADDVINQLWAVAFADPNEICQYRRCACRYCWGEGFLYQSTPQEMRSAEAAYERHKAAAKPGEPFPPFDERGGVGFNPNLAPNPDCPECHGNGDGDPFIKDTRHLSPEVRSLFAGLKVTKEGVEIKVASQERARELLMKHLGLLTEKVEIDDISGLNDQERADRVAVLLAKARAARVRSVADGPAGGSAVAAASDDPA